MWACSGTTSYWKGSWAVINWKCPPFFGINRQKMSDSQENKMDLYHLMNSLHSFFNRWIKAMESSIGRWVRAESWPGCLISYHLLNGTCQSNDAILTKPIQLPLDCCSKYQKYLVYMYILLPWIYSNIFMLLQKDAHRVKKGLKHLGLELVVMSPR